MQVDGNKAASEGRDVFVSHTATPRENVGRWMNAYLPLGNMGWGGMVPYELLRNIWWGGGWSHKCSLATEGAGGSSQKTPHAIEREGGFSDKRPLVN